MAFTTVSTLYQSLNKILKLKWMNPTVPLNRKIRTGELHRPGLMLAAYYDYFTYDRIQVLGKTEMAFMKKLTTGKRKKNLKKFFNYKIPAIVVTKNQIVPSDFLQRATEAKIPVFKTSLATSTVCSRITVFLEEDHAPETAVHGTLVDVYGVGILLLGKSSIGKSECALELVERGHRLVADDMIRIKLEHGTHLVGFANDTIRHFMEIRGIGLLDIQEIFGVSAVRNVKRIAMVVTLETWEKGKEYERLGLDEAKHSILGIPLPHLVLPVKPGRNLPVLVEVAALIQRSKRMGVHSSKNFNLNLMKKMGITSNVIKDGAD
jgi:HPr kinase/phosphorylase